MKMTMKTVWIALAGTFLGLCLPLAASATGEIKGTDATGKSVYAVIINPTGQVWTGSAFAATTGGNFLSGVVVETEVAGTGFFLASFPAGITAPGRYTALTYERLGASPAVGDLLIQQGVIDWSGATVVGAGNTILAASEYANIAAVTSTYGFDGPPAGTILTLTITRNGSSQPVLTWTADPAATLYKVYRSTDGANYTVIATPATGTLTYTDTARPAGATVYYHITSTH